MNKAIFLDRDGTINREKHYLYQIGEFEFLPGVIEALKLLQDEGYLLIIITNQSGIGRGYYTEEEFKILNSWMLRELKRHGIYIARVYYCPHCPDAQIEKYKKVCTCRKPSLGMYEQALRDFDIEMELSWSIGDKIRDCAICEKSKCRGYLIADNEKANIIKAVKEGFYPNVRYADNLLACAKQITFQTGG